VLSRLEAASEAIGKGRGSGEGLARIISRAAAELEPVVETCIRGCWGSRFEARCIVGEAFERLKDTMQGIAVRLSRMGRFEGEHAEELASMLIDVLYSLVEGLCKVYSVG
jgi:hypothetical protein